MIENQKINNHKPCYLKVVPLKNTLILEVDKAVKNYVNNMYKENKQNFGFLKELIRLDNARVYQFKPFSKDWGVSHAKYKTQQEALEKAISFFNKIGFRAIPFDLEKILGGVK